MNKRIKQLLIQSEVFNKDGTVLKDVTGYELKKFAELIVRECIYWCNAHARDDGTAQRIAEDIKKDFGVEE